MPFTEKTSKKHLFLTGFRGTGKSTVARIISDFMNIPLVDLDHQIEEFARERIPEIFVRHGESHFRELERSELAKLINAVPSIVALGGGAVVKQENRDFIRENGYCVLLTAEPATILNRLENDESTRTSRPPLTDLGRLEEIQEMLVRRKGFYSEVADLELSTDEMDPRKTSELIAEWWREMLAN